jgi:hypothetical protein
MNLTLFAKHATKPTLPTPETPAVKVFMADSTEAGG